MALLSRQRPQTRCRRCSVNITLWANRLWISKTRLPDACEVMTKRTTRTDSASQTRRLCPGDAGIASRAAVAAGRLGLMRKMGAFNAGGFSLGGLHGTWAGQTR